MRRGLCSVDDHDCAMLMGQICDFFNRICNAQDIGNLCAGYNGCLVRNLCQFALRQISLAVTFHIHQLCACLTRHHLPGQNIGMMLHDRNDDFISRAHVRESIAVGYQIQRFCRISCKNNLAVALRTDKLRNCMTCVFICICSIHTPFVQSAERVRIALCIELIHRIKYSLRTLRSRRIIKINCLVLILYENREILTIRIHQLCLSLIKYSILQMPFRCSLSAACGVPHPESPGPRRQALRGP